VTAMMLFVELKISVKCVDLLQLLKGLQVQSLPLNPVHFWCAENSGQRNLELRVCWLVLGSKSRGPY
jgi:hypothetical protein